MRTAKWLFVLEQYAEFDLLFVLQLDPNPMLNPSLTPGCIPCKLYAGDTPTLTIDSIVICQTHAGYLALLCTECTLAV